jgi:hypothetical protein
MDLIKQMMKFGKNLATQFVLLQNIIKTNQNTKEFSHRQLRLI